MLSVANSEIRVAEMDTTPKNMPKALGHVSQASDEVAGVAIYLTPSSLLGRELTWRNGSWLMIANQIIGLQPAL